jgi:hypothetical protein
LISSLYERLDAAQGFVCRRPRSLAGGVRDAVSARCNLTTYVVVT